MHWRKSFLQSDGFMLTSLDFCSQPLWLIKQFPPCNCGEMNFIGPICQAQGPYISKPVWEELNQQLISNPGAAASQSDSRSSQHCFCYSHPLTIVSLKRAIAREVQQKNHPGRAEMCVGWIFWRFASPQGQKGYRNRSSVLLIRHIFGPVPALFVCVFKGKAMQLHWNWIIKAIVLSFIV